MKQLQKDPWLDEVESLKKGTAVEGTVTRITPFGAFVQLSPAVEALVHISELGSGSDVDPEKVFTLNERKNFTVLDVDRDNRVLSTRVPDAQISNTGKGDVARAGRQGWLSRFFSVVSPF